MADPSLAEALWFPGGRIKGVGYEEEVRAVAGEGVEIVDLGGGTLLSRFIEP
jgi:predicted amidohydrolase YtcJ